MPYLLATAISKSYGGFVALNDASLRVERGQVVGLLGVNGAGKSSLLKILATLLRPDSGSVLIESEDALAYPKKIAKKIGYLSEVAPVYKWLSVLEHLRFLASLKRIPAEQTNEEVERVMRLTHITLRRNSIVNTLSKGLQQRVALSACLLGSPSLLLMDEPSSGLDPMESMALRNLILKEKKRNTAIVFSTHVVSELEAVADEVVVVHSGKNIAMLQRTNQLNDMWTNKTIGHARSALNEDEEGGLHNRKYKEYKMPGVVIASSPVSKKNRQEARNESVDERDAKNETSFHFLLGFAFLAESTPKTRGRKKQATSIVFERTVIPLLQKKIDVWQKQCGGFANLLLKQNKFDGKSSSANNQLLIDTREAVVTLKILFPAEVESADMEKKIDVLVAMLLQVALRNKFVIRNFVSQHANLAYLFEAAVSRASIDVMH